MVCKNGVMVLYCQKHLELDMLFRMFQLPLKGILHLQEDLKMNGLFQELYLVLMFK